MDVPTPQVSSGTTKLRIKSLVRSSRAFIRSRGGQKIDPYASNFTTPVFAQTQSRFLSLPTEIRLIIYGFVDIGSKPYGSPGHRFPLASTCRLVHGEVIPLELRHVRIHFHDANSHACVKNISSLGPLQQNLRYVRICYSSLNLDPFGSNNPFLLSRLPLKELNITLKKSIWDKKKFSDDYMYRELISALFYLTPVHALDKDEISNPIYTSNKESLKRQMLMLARKWKPQDVELHNILHKCEAKAVVIQTEFLTSFLRDAFLKFNLSNPDSYMTIFLGLRQNSNLRPFVNYLKFGRSEEEFNFVQLLNVSWEEHTAFMNSIDL